jgi:hypothetical protein
VIGTTHLGDVEFDESAENNNQIIRVYFYKVVLTLNFENFMISEGSYSIEDTQSIIVNTIFNTGFTSTII